MSTSPKVAILGASGIGKNHARWFHKHGCEVVAFLGSSPASLQRTQHLLNAQFPFDGRGYTDLAQLLEQEKPDIVCVSTPPAHHFEQVARCLHSGAHVLCEKPLVYDASAPFEDVVQQAQSLVELAHDRGLLFGTQMQYAAVIEELLRAAGHEGAMRSFGMEMETKNVKDGREGEHIWLDLSPHPLSVVQVLAGPHARIEPGSIACRVEKHQTRAQLRVAGPERSIECSFTVRFDPQANPPRRGFRFDDAVVEVGGRRDAEGEFRAVLTSQGRETVMPDFVDVLVGNFLAATRGEQELLVTGAMGAQNVAWQHEILAASQS
jgi:predicted dehydrogenase